MVQRFASSWLSLNPTLSAMKIRYATLCKQGKRRNNEDYLMVVSHPEQSSWMVIICDGMGGHASGEVASKTVAESISRYWDKHLCYRDDMTKVEKACQNAFRTFNQKSRHVEMGTTMVMASIQNEQLTIAHLGDSRCYLLRKEEGCIFQTIDHTSISDGWEVITRSFFTDCPEAVEPDVHQEKLQEGDKILLCSDGIYKFMTPEAWIETLMKEVSLEEIIQMLDNTLEKNGHDNYSAIIVEVTNQ